MAIDPRVLAAAAAGRLQEIASSGCAASSAPAGATGAVLAGLDGTPERSTPGTDHCHQMLLLSLLRRILRQRQKKGSDLPFADIQGAPPPPRFFSFLSYQMTFAYAQPCTFVCGMRPLE